MLWNSKWHGKEGISSLGFGGDGQGVLHWESEVQAKSWKGVGLSQQTSEGRALSAGGVS